MARLFVYEWATAREIGRDQDDPAHTLYREGRAMRDAVAADLRLAGHDVLHLELGGRSDQEKAAFQNVVKKSDHVLVIAPELAGELTRRCEWVVEVGASLLGPDLPAIRLCSDKLALAQHWSMRGVRTPRTRRFTDWQESPPQTIPAIGKPIDGAGSTAIRRFDSLREIGECRDAGGYEGYRVEDLLLQDFVPGLAASVAFLVGPDSCTALAPARQILDPAAGFKYLGGEVPLESEIAARALAIARQAVGSVPGLRGYVGVDVVVGTAADGSDTFAIEINPRLTTSYVGLRALAEVNLAQLMYLASTGAAVPAPTWKQGRVRFDPDGSIFEMDTDT